MALTDNLRAYYKLDTTTNEPADATGNGYRMYPVANPTSGAAGIIGSAFDFEAGSSQYAQCLTPEMTLSAQCSISCWVKLESWPAGGQVMFGRRTGSNDCQFYIYGGGGGLGFINWGCSPNGHFPSVADSAITSGAWQHLVATYDGAYVNLYTDNVKVYSAACTGTIVALSSDTKLGSDASAGSNELDGVMDEIGIWDRGLTPAEVNLLYSGGVGWQYPWTPAAAGTNFKINIGDSFKTIDSMKINIGDSWKNVTSAKINIGDAWKTIF